MARPLTALLLSVALVTAGCGERDYGDLPKDAKERAMLCTRAGVMMIGTVPAEDKERLQRVSDKARELANADGFYTLFPGSNDDPGKVLGEDATIHAAVASHWASTINSCFRAYGIEEEPIPQLPQPPYERAAACAAAIAFDNLGGRKIDPEARIAYDPQAGYFVHKAAVLAGGAGQLVKASDDSTAQLQRVIMAGTARSWAAQCKKEDSKAEKAAVSLPADDAAALAICDDALGFAEEGGLAAESRQSDAAKRYAAGYRATHAKFAAMPDPGPATVENAVKFIADSGRLDQIGDACIARFGS